MTALADRLRAALDHVHEPELLPGDRPGMTIDDPRMPAAVLVGAVPASESHSYSFVALQRVPRRVSSGAKQDVSLLLLDEGR